MIPVNSSWVGALDYANGVLTVMTRSGRQYRYIGVPEKVWANLQASTSVGQFINSHIKGRYKEQ